MLKIHLTEHLEVTYVRYGIGPNILRMEFEKVEDLSEELWAGQWEATVHVVSKNDHLTISRIGPFFFWVRGTVRHDSFRWQKSYGEELFQTFLSYGWGNPVTDGWCFGRPDVQRRTEKKSNMPVQFNGEINS